MRALILFLFTPVALSAKAPRIRHPVTTGTSSFANILATCLTGYEMCEGGCIGAGDDCCNDGTGESCEAGYYCIPGACCPKGEDCGDSAGSDDTTGCDVDSVPCGDDYCMPLTGTCCTGQGYYCPDYGTCTSDGLCCAAGDDCDGSSSSSALSVTSTKEIETSPTSTSTATTTDSDRGGINLLITTVAGGGGSSKTTQPPIIVTVTPSPIPLTSGQAGRRRITNGQIVAGLAVVVALLA
ncbi:hypothetical protein GGR51DRAFT_527824 [Nemania sp. FL0031]|nr:hypothetical protein GGR51DRAFT_527824 [Nemania sp. FL0031]